MKKINSVILTLLVIGAAAVQAQLRPASTPDVSNKALITKTKPDLTSVSSTAAANLHKLANEFYAWRNQQFPVRSSDAGLHTWDDRLTDYSAGENRGARAAYPTHCSRR